jgi:prevent-host-death family protein
MRKVSITEAKNKLSALIDGLKGSSPILIVDRGRPVARLEPMTAEVDAEPGARLSRLVRDGVVRPRRAAPPRTVFSQPPPRAKPGVSAVEALLAERRESR